MGFFDKIKGEFVDIIEWLDDSNNTMAYRFERFQNEIKNGAKLTVREGQVAVLINEGQLADVYAPGMYELTTENMPILSTLKGWKFGFNSPFKVEVYFVSTRNITDQKWGTKNPITLADQRFGMLEVRAFGTYVIKIKDAPIFIKEIVGTDGHFTTEEIANQLKSMIVTRFTDAIGEANLPVENYASNLNEISDYVHGVISPEFEQYGIEVTKFLIENVSMPEEIKKEIFELSRLHSVDLNKLTQMKAAKAMEAAANNDSGAAGAGIGMGMGFGMANQMAGSFANQQQAAPQQSSAVAPPPIPQSVAFFAAINGQQAGPYEVAVLKEMVTKNEINKDTLIWREGMANWTAAGEVPDVTTLFASVPPPSRLRLDEYLAKKEIQVDSFACSKCAADLTYKPGSDHLTCQYCGAENEIPKSNVEIKEFDFASHLKDDAKKEEKITEQFVGCAGCGGSITLEPNVSSAHCPYCDSPLIVSEVHDESIIKPKSLLPFKLNKNEAKNEFGKWVKSLFFAPNDLQKAVLNFEHFKGIYIPHWTYDTKTVSNYVGKRGERSSNSKQTHWTDVSGTVSNDFDDLLVPATKSVPRKLMDKLEPWDMDNLVPYDRSYLSGFITEKYQVDLEEGFEIAKEVAEVTIRRRIKRKIGGNRTKITELDTSWDDIAFKHVLLPVFVSAYKFKDKVYQFVVNARTGEVYGESPISKIKVVAAVILVSIGISIALFVASKQ